MSEKRTTVGVLYPGEMGSRLAEMLRTQGHRVISVVVGRSRRTRGLCREAGIETVDSLRELARLAEV
ncbi:MAG: 6-phosphogluconate dehydrogenase, partial [Planctomycetota bacterium]